MCVCVCMCVHVSMCVYVCVCCRSTSRHSYVMSLICTHHITSRTCPHHGTRVNTSRHSYVITGWRRFIGCSKLQVSFRKRSTNDRVFCGKWPMKIRHPVTLRHPVHSHDAPYYATHVRTHHTKSVLQLIVGLFCGKWPMEIRHHMTHMTHMTHIYDSFSLGDSYDSFSLGESYESYESYEMTQGIRHHMTLGDSTPPGTLTCTHHIMPPICARITQNE